MEPPVIGRLRHAADAVQAAGGPLGPAIGALLRTEADLHADDPSFARGTAPLCEMWPHAVTLMEKIEEAGWT